MWVNLRTRWFDPNAVRRRPENNPHNFPDEWEKLLPKNAEVLKKDEAKELDKAEKEAAKAEKAEK